MIFRAIFWIGLVSLLAPHEPDLGLGRPGAGSAFTSPASIQPSANGLSRHGSDCGFACAGALPSVFHLNANGALIDGVKDGLAEVKSQIEQARKDRAARARAA